MRLSAPHSALAFAVAFIAGAMPGRITASTAPAPAKREPWFAVKAAANGAELRLRGYIGEASKYVDYYGNEHETGGMGTLKEFEDALTALGEVPLITVYITSEGGDFPTAVAISSILARQKARIVCVIDGYCYSAAPVIACAADEVRAAKNALLMIHDAEFWCSGADVATLEQHIATLKACNDSMAQAFVNKAGGTTQEWITRMVATTWMTGAQAAELGLVDTLLDDVALSAYQPLKRVTAHYRPPAEITALIDTPAPSTPKASSPPPSTPPPMKPTPELITAAAKFGITLTTESSEADVSAALVKIAAAAPAPQPPTSPSPPTAPLTLEQVTAAVGTAVTTAVKPLEDKITAQEKEIKHLKGVKDQGLGGEGSPTASSPAPVAGTKKEGEEQPLTPRQSAVTALAKLPVFGGSK